MPENYTQHHILRQEAHFYGYYLITRKPDEDFVERYVDANVKLGLNTVSGHDVRIVHYSLTHPWSIPFLDAATGILMPESLLRKKIYTMAAILEASTKYTEFFLPSNLSLSALIGQLLSNGLLVSMKILIGLPLFIFVKGCK